MECLEPMYLKESKTSVKCGRCPPCKKAKSRDWQFRLYIEHKKSKYSKFLTLTYDDDHIPFIVENGKYLTNLKKSDLQSFIKRLRHVQDKYHLEHSNCKNMRETRQKHPRIRYYGVGEYGDQTERAHYHLIIFNLEPELHSQLNEIWRKGHVHIGTCNAKTIAYTMKYVLKQDIVQNPYSRRQEKFSIQSKRPFLGFQYLDTHKRYHITTQSTTVRDINGKKIPLPAIYRDKIFSRFTKEKLNSELVKSMDDKFLKRELELVRKLGVPEKYYVEELKNYIRKQTKLNRLKKDKNL